MTVLTAALGVVGALLLLAGLVGDNDDPVAWAMTLGGGLLLGAALFL